MKIVGIGGVPATGKTTLARLVMASLDRAEGAPGAFFQEGLLRGYAWPEQRALVLGVYDDSLFSGTDRLSMAVQPVGENFVAKLAAHIPPAPFTADGREWSMFFEGDRLFTRAFLAHCRRFAPASCLFAVLMAESAEGRRALRVQKGLAKAMDPIWLKGRESKVSKIANDASLGVKLWRSETYDDLATNARAVMSHLELPCISS